MATKPTIVSQTKVPKVVVDKLPEVWAVKMVSYYRSLAPSDDGRVYEDEFIASLKERANDHETARNCIGRIMLFGFKLWKLFIAPTTREAGGRHYITWTDFLKIRFNSVINTEGKAKDKECISDLATTLFRCLNLDPQHRVGVSDLMDITQLFLPNMIRVKEEELIPALGLEKHGAMSEEEYTGATVNFFHCTAADRGAMVYGGLAEHVHTDKRTKF